MSDKPDESAKSGEQEASVAPTKADAEQAGSQAAEDGFQKTVAELRTENSELRDKLLRNMAETENFRRRAEREKSDVAKYAVSEFARNIVSIGDNLRRAIEAVPKEAVERDPALKTLIDGLEVTERELLKVFERQGITRFDPIGEKFDPHVHEAMVRVDVPNVPANVVVQVLQAGYKIADRVLRPAAVIVSKGTPAQPQSDRSDSAQSAGGGEDVSDGGEPHRDSHVAQNQDSDAVHAASGSKANSGQTGGRRSSGEKRASTVTKPVTDQPHKKDDLISSFGKRLDNGN